MRANGRSSRCIIVGKISPRPITVNVANAAHRIASWGRCSADNSAEPARVTTLKLQTRPAITRYDRAPEVLTRLLFKPDKNTTGSTGRMHGETPVIRPPRNPISAMVSMAVIRNDRGCGRAETNTTARGWRTTGFGRVVGSRALITRSDTCPHVGVVVGGLLDAPPVRSAGTPRSEFCLDPTVEQHELLARHGGASRFAFNQCLRMVKTALTQRKIDQDTEVPWTGFDLINAFNAWKKTEDAGRVFSVDTDGLAQTVVTGLAWRTEVCQQVFEEAAVDLGKGLKAWSHSRSGKRNGKNVGFPRFKKKTGAVPSFRLRNKRPKDGLPAIRIGEGNRPRSITLPGVGQIGVHADTRRLRRMLSKGRAKICLATNTHHGGRWWVSLNIEAADLHPARRHAARHPDDGGGWIGLDRGLSAFLVAATADGGEAARSH